MSNSNNSSRSLSRHVYVASVAGDEKSGRAPLPGMSHRAKLIARTLVVAALALISVAIEPSLLVAIAFVLPFWVAVEAEAPSLGVASATQPFRISAPLRLIAPCWHGDARDSTPRDSTPRAA